MEIDTQRLKERISNLSDEELVEMLTTEKDSYQERALDLAREEMASRGGLPDLKARMEQLESENLRQKRDLDKRVETVREKYSYFDHVRHILWRWKAVYGIMIVGYLLYLIANQEDTTMVQAVFSLRFFASLLVILVLAVIYAVINALFTYRESLLNLCLITCPRCGHYRVMQSRYLKMKLDKDGYYRSECPKCKTPIQTDLRYLLEEDRESSHATPMPQSQHINAEPPQQTHLASLPVDLYLGAFKRKKWQIDLTPESAVFRDLNNPENSITVSKKIAADAIRIYSSRTVNIELTQGDQRMKFISFDPSDLIHWLD